jgi:hypothetical protein
MILEASSKIFAAEHEVAERAAGPGWGLRRRRRGRVGGGKKKYWKLVDCRRFFRFNARESNLAFKETE